MDEETLIALGLMELEVPDMWGMMHEVYSNEFQKEFEEMQRLSED